MKEGDALYRTILAAPDDDTPRLVYADWLQEHGQEQRAELVRAQCKLARNRFNTGDPGGPTLTAGEMVECGKLKKRERVLLKAFAADWWNEFCAFLSERTAHLPGRAEIDFQRKDVCDPALWDRGFIHALPGISGDGWNAHADAILEHTLVRQVELTSVPLVERLGQSAVEGLTLVRLPHRSLVLEVPDDAPHLHQVGRLIDAHWHPRVKWSFSAELVRAAAADALARAGAAMAGAGLTINEVRAALTPPPTT